jgi:hypothetical protein
MSVEDIFCAGKKCFKGENLDIKDFYKVNCGVDLGFFDTS